MSRTDKYILGLLSPARVERFEKAYIENYKLAQQVEQQTERLLDAYVEGRLNPKISQLVRQRIWQLPGLQARVDEKQLFLDFIARQPRVVLAIASPSSYRLRWSIAMLTMTSVVLLFGILSYQKLHTKEPREIVKVVPEIRPIEPASEIRVTKPGEAIAKVTPKKSKPIKPGLLTSVLLLPTILRTETDSTILTARPRRKIRADLVVGEAGTYKVTLTLKSGELIKKAHRIQTKSSQKKLFLSFVLPKHLRAGKYKIKAENANETLLYSFEVK